MNNFQLPELAIIGTIIFLQFVTFIRTLKRIHQYRKIFPLQNAYYLSRGYGNIDSIEAENPSPVFGEILTTLNTYLARNKSAAADFHLVKDVVERNVNAAESHVEQNISLPLYLGLLGTLLGIVCGLFSASGQLTETGQTAGASASLLLDGVKFAMIASFTGLALTIYHSGVSYKIAKKVTEDRKNQFYKFIQDELFPILNENINSTFHSLQTNLFQFNQQFSANINKLSGAMAGNYDALASQAKVLATLEKMDMVNFADANVKVLQELRKSTDQFQTFASYMEGMNELLSNTRACVAAVSNLIGRTETLNVLAKKIEASFEFNKQLQEFLQHHYSSLEESQQVFDRKLTEVGDHLSGSLEQLKTFTQEQIVEIRRITTREMDLMQSQYPERWKQLEKLSFLESMNSNITEIKNTANSQSKSISNEMLLTNAKLEKVMTELAEIKRITTESVFSKWTKKILGKK